jgi:hypothetical protein
MGHLLPLLGNLLGFIAFALSMSKHQKQILALTLSARMRLLLRSTGWLLLALAYGCAVYSLGWAFGSVAWFGHLSVAAGCLFIYLAFFNHWRANKQSPKPE